MSTSVVGIDMTGQCSFLVRYVSNPTPNPAPNPYLYPYFYPYP